MNMRHKKFKVGSVYLIEWVDSSGMTEYWVNHNNIVPKLLHCSSLGRVVIITKNSILLAQSWNEFQSGGVLEIPLVNVVKSKRLIA